jgi:hypothetical protein
MPGWGANAGCFISLFSPFLYGRATAAPQNHKINIMKFPPKRFHNKFLLFSQIFCETIAFFLKTNVVIHVLQNSAMF